VCSILRADLYAISVSQSWNSLLFSLYGHKHLSPFIQQSIVNFQMLSSKILEARPLTADIVEGSSSRHIHFQDMAWLDSLSASL
jgi:hypothetical protein